MQNYNCLGVCLSFPLVSETVCRSNTSRYRHLCQHSVQTPNYAALFVLQTAVLFYRAKHLSQINGVILLLLGDSKVVRKFEG